ncbi:clan AA aspartic protease [filamentous cyanobacterium CCP1]|nr:clan AA aspartic protease [filamentous cyanobacterium CCP2]PSB67064.1 clan AA aspartic protease [filamentous cyanobacterium CCP1]
MDNTTEMGAIRVPVKLTNAVDKGLINRGSLAPCYLRQVETQGLVDTGALTLVIPLAIAQQLGLQIERQQIARYANGYEEAIGVSEAVIIECEGRSTVDEALIVGDEVLIGQVILEKLDLWADCKNQRLIPNPEHPDYPVAMIK